MKTRRADCFFIMIFVICFALLAETRIAGATPESQEAKEADQKLDDTENKEPEASAEAQTGAQKEKEELQKDLARAQASRERRQFEDRLDRRDSDRR